MKLGTINRIGYKRYECWFKENEAYIFTSFDNARLFLAIKGIDEK